MRQNVSPQTPPNKKKTRNDLGKKKEGLKGVKGEGGGGGGRGCYSREESRRRLYLLTRRHYTNFSSLLYTPRFKDSPE